jgi:membrane protease YdiL (CAAX protease family)
MEARVQMPPADAPVGVDPKPWGVPAILLALIIPVFFWGSSLAVSISQGAPQHLSGGEIITAIILTIILDLGFIGLAVWLALRRHHRKPDALGLRPFDRNLWWMPLAAAGGAHLAIIVYSLVLSAVGAGGAVPKQEDLDQLFSSPAILPLTGLATVVMAPIAEEIFFRGFIFGGLVRPLGLFGAMLVSGFIFGAFHIQGASSVGLLLPFGLVGMLFAWLYYRTGSILPSMGAHFLFNLVSFVALASLGGSG